MLMIFIASSCVPIEKVTECGPKETFDAGLKKCVQTQGKGSYGSISISSISPSSQVYTLREADPSVPHNIIVKDVYQSGYIVNWTLYLPSGIPQVVANNTTSYTVNPLSPFFTQNGTYMLNATVWDYDQQVTLDQRSWSINFLKTESPKIIPIDFPLGNVYTEVNSTLLEISVSFDKLLKANARIDWYLDGTPTLTDKATSTLNGVRFTAQNSGVIGTAIVLNFDGVQTVSTVVNNWNASNPTNTVTYSGLGSTVFTASTASLVLPTNITTTSTSQITTSKISLNPSGMTTGNHTLFAKLSDGNNTLYDEKLFNIFIKIPDFTSVFVSANAGAQPNVTTTAVDGVPQTAGGIFQGSGNQPVNFCAYVDNYQGTANVTGVSNVYAQFYLNGAKLGGTVNFQGNGEASRICVTDLSGFTNFSFDHSQPVPINIESQSIRMDIYDRGSDMILNPVQDYKITEFSWPVNVRPKNTAPVASINDSAMVPLQKLDTISGNLYYELTEDQPFTFEIEISDNDSYKFIATGANGIDNQFETRWKLDGVLLDGTSTYLNTPVTTPDCFVTYGETHADKLTCTITIPSYTNTGVNSQTDYTLVADVTDVSFYPGGPKKTSTTVDFKIKVLEAQNPPEIQPMTYVGSTTNYSYISLQNDPLKPRGYHNNPLSGALNERDDVILNIVVKDSERDAYYRMIEMCRTQNLGIFSNCTIISGLQQISRSDSNEYHKSTHYFRIPENAVIGASQADVFFKVTIQDTPSSLPGAATVNSEPLLPEDGSGRDTPYVSNSIFMVRINNKNPAPVLSQEEYQVPSREPEVSGDPLPEYYVYPGFPFTIYPGEVTDSSISDGKNILYQWQVCEVSQCSVAGGWIDIPNAIQKNLVWTPPTEFEGQEVNIRLCIGDDGFGNDLTSCLTAPSVPPIGSNIIMAGPWTNIFVKANAVANFGEDIFSNFYNPSGELATWVDASGYSPVSYNAYSSCITTNDCRLVIDKIQFMTDGSAHNNSQTSIVIPTESGGASPAPRDITLIGDEINKTLFVAYTVADANTVPVGIQTIRVRRIDIGDDKFGFNYSGNGMIIDDFSTQNMVVDYQTDSIGSAQIQFVNTSQLDPSDIITINAVAFTGTYDFGISNLNDNFAVASEFADAINNSTDPRISGVIKATATGSTVVIDGLPKNDFIDFQVYAKKLGRLMIDPSSGKLLLPFIDGLNDSKLSVIGMDSTLQLGDQSNIVDYVKITQSLEMTEIDNEMSYDGNFYIAKRSLNGFVYVYMYNDLLNSNANAVMTGSDSEVFSAIMSNIKVSAPKMGNDYAFVGGIGLDKKLNIARMSHLDFASGSVVLSKSEPLIDNTLFPTITSAMNTIDYDLETFPNHPQECILAVASSDDAVHNPDFRQRALIMKIQSNDIYSGTSPLLLDEGEAYVSHSGEQVVLDPTARFEIQLSSVISGFAFGSAGYNTEENMKDFVIYNYHSGTPSTGKLISTIVNVRDEEIQATSPGQNTAPYNPAFFNPTPPIDPNTLQGQ